MEERYRGGATQSSAFRELRFKPFENAVEVGVQCLQSAIRKEAKIAMVSCDFCAWGDPIWQYPCKDFNTDEVVVRNTSFGMASSEGWLACNECSDLIEQENLDELGQRSLRSAVPIEAESRLSEANRADLKRWVKNTHLDFMKHRTGPRQPLSFEDPVEGE